MKYIFIPLFSLLLILPSIAQKMDRPYRNLVTQEVNERLRKQYLSSNAQLKKGNFLVSEFRRVDKLKSKTIPIIFHILYNSSEEKISLEQIQSQIDALNRDFKHEVKTIDHPAEQLENFASRRPERTNIDFCLALVQANSKRSGGLESIRYVKTKIKKWGADDAIKSTAKGGADIVHPNNYLNVWVGHFEDKVSGYAQLPGGPEATDGIAIDYRFFGIGGTSIAPYNEGKTLTHLVGNYLGLLDLWNNKKPCSDDGISDTPIHNAPNTGCPIYKHISLCGNSPVEMTMNFMDNTDDACMNMFTYGQIQQMHATLNPQGSRYQLTVGQSYCKPQKEEPEKHTTEPGPSIQLAAPSLTLQPNPAKNLVQITIEAYEGEVQLTIYNSMGQLINRKQFMSPTTNLNCEDWVGGIYFIHAQLGDRQITNQLVIAH